MLATKEFNKQKTSFCNMIKIVSVKSKKKISIRWFSEKTLIDFEEGYKYD